MISQASRFLKLLKNLHEKQFLVVSILLMNKSLAGVVELVDTCDSKSHAFGREGSSPSSGTQNINYKYTDVFVVFLFQPKAIIL